MTAILSAGHESMIDIGIGCSGTIHCRRLQELLGGIEDEAFRQNDVLGALLHAPHSGRRLEGPLSLGEAVDAGQHRLPGFFESIDQVGPLRVAHRTAAGMAQRCRKETEYH
jgi:hypothetical protein